MDTKSKKFKDILLSFLSKLLKWQVVVGIFTIIGVIFGLWSWYMDHSIGYEQIVAETAVRIEQLRSDCAKYKIDTTDIKNDQIGDLTYIKDFQECALEYCDTYELYASSIQGYKGHDKIVDTDSLMLNLKIGYNVLLKSAMIAELNKRMAINVSSCCQIYLNNNMNEWKVVDVVSMRRFEESHKGIKKRNDEIKEMLLKCMLNSDLEDADKALTQFITSAEYAKYYRDLTTMYMNFNKVFNSRIAKTKSYYQISK